MKTKKHKDLLYKELSYEIQGAAIEVRKNFGSGLKETIYQNAFAEELKSRNIKFDKEKSIQIFSPKTGKLVGSYRPDFIIEDKIIIELKAVEKIPKMFLDQIFSYLRNSKYELGYFINFSSPKLYIKRLIFTNDRKPFLRHTQKDTSIRRIATKFSCLLVFSLVFLSVFASLTQAAELYLKSSQDKYSPNEIFKVEVRLNVSPGENVTAIEGKIKYNPSDLKAVEFLTGNSILTFVDQAQIDENNGLVSFSGIIPGGYTGQLLGDPGESNLLGTIAFQVLKTNNPLTTIQVANDSRILVDAGQELKTNLIFKSLTININPQEIVFNPINELEAAKEADKILPEEFTPEIIQTNNQYFVAFNTQDKQSGIDHYDLNILERNFWGKLKVSQKITNITSPYPLTQDDIKKPLQIIAFDKAGNERKAFLNPLAELKWYQKYLVWGIIIIGVIIIFGVIMVLWGRNKKIH